MIAGGRYFGLFERGGGERGSGGITRYRNHNYFDNILRQTLLPLDFHLHHHCYEITFQLPQVIYPECRKIPPGKLNQTLAEYSDNLQRKLIQITSHRCYLAQISHSTLA